MLRVIIRQARPGMILARSIPHPREPGRALLETSFLLDAPTIAQLHELGVYDLWVTNPELDFLDDLYSADLTSQQQRLFESLKAAFIEQAQLGDFASPAHDFRPTVEELTRTILNAAATAPVQSLLAAPDESLLRHSSEVCALGLALGLRMDAYLADQRKKLRTQKSRDLLNLGLGCFLHDIGELHVDQGCRESKIPFAFDPDAPPQWQQHTHHGFTVTRGQLDPSAATIVLNHHQHFDGSGFPAAPSHAAPQCGSQIHIFARIAMAADTFVHLRRQSGVAQPTLCALSQILQNPIRQWFDPVVLAALLSVVPPFVPGMVVTLSDRRQAIVTRTHEDAPCYPEVQILENLHLTLPGAATDIREILDLAETPGLFIKIVDGFEVSESLYGVRHAGGMPKPVRREVVGVG